MIKFKELYKNSYLKIILTYINLLITNITNKNYNHKYNKYNKNNSMSYVIKNVIVIKIN